MKKPAYIRVGRNPVEDVYEEGNVPFAMDKATMITQGSDVAIIACGEMVKPARDAAGILKEKGISASVVDMYCVKPLDEETVIPGCVRGQGSHHCGGARALRRPGFHGKPGGCKGMPKESD